jgi:hypothetical protein
LGWMGGVFSSEHFVSKFRRRHSRNGKYWSTSFFTEFSPEPYLTGMSQARQLTDWQRLMGVAINSGEVEGIIGPWTFRKSDNGGVTGNSHWIIDDSVNPSGDTGTDTLVSKWPKSYIPTIIPRT